MNVGHCRRVGLFLSHGIYRICEEVFMRTILLPLPRFAFIIGTRAALAAGIALLVSDKVPPARRRAAGIVLVAFGAATTIPALMWVRRSAHRENLSGHSSVHRDDRLIGATRFPRKGDDEIAG